MSTAANSESDSSPIRVAIVGGGIAGLILAIALTQSSNNKAMSIHLYEAAAKFNETGAGIGMYRRPWQVMKSLELVELVKSMTNVPEPEEDLHLAFKSSKADEPASKEHFDMFIPFGNVTLHRVEFQDALAHHLEQKAITTHFSKRLLNYTLQDDGSVLLHFKDDSTEVCDVLVGADGIHSATRQTMVDLAVNEARAAGKDELVKDLSRDPVKDPVWSGTVAYRAIIPSEKLQELNPNHATLHSPINYMGKDRHIVAFPISRGKAVNFVGFASQPEREGAVFEGKTVEQRTREDVAAAYHGWEAEVQQLVQCIDHVSMWTINTLKALPIASHGAVALIGDAAHAMTPHQGSGAGQAIEDAYVLAALLTHSSTTRKSIPRTLKIYEKVRLPHANEIQRRSRENGKLYEFASHEQYPHLSSVEASGGDPDKLVKNIVSAAVENWKWAWTTVVETEKEEAIRLLVEGVEV